MPKKGSADESSKGYENPAFAGDGGDRSGPAKGGKVGGEYDNSANEEPKGGAPGKKNAAQNAQALQKDKFQGKSASDGYENVKLDQDFGFKGHGKKSKPTPD